jgi:hypothetical protein
MKAYRGVRILTTKGKTKCWVPFDGTVYEMPDIDCARAFIDHCLKGGAKADGALTVEAL